MPFILEEHVKQIELRRRYYRLLTAAWMDQYDWLTEHGFNFLENPDDRTTGTWTSRLPSTINAHHIIKAEEHTFQASRMNHRITAGL